MRRTHPPQPDPDDEKSRMQRWAADVLIRACQMDHGKIDFSVWDGRAANIRPIHSAKPSGTNWNPPTPEWILKQDVVQEAARVLASLYWQRAVYIITVQDGRFALLNLRPKARLEVAWHDDPD
jgi:hypothetical protein